MFIECDWRKTSYSYIKAALLSVYPKRTVQERLSERPIDAVVAGVTAAYLHGMGAMHEGPYTFVVGKRRQTTMHVLVFHIRSIEENDVTVAKTIPVTTMERMVADPVRERCDPDHVIQAAIDAVGKGARFSRICECLNMLELRYQEVVSILEPSIVTWRVL